MNTLTDSELKSYLKRIHIDDIKPATLEFLSELHRAHVQYLSWQTIDIFTGRPEAIDLANSVRLVLQGRSGYCFHLNGAFSILLRSLGYEVQWHRAGVQPHGEQPRVNSFHLGLSVLLPEAGPETERWIVDVGLGGMPFEPLPLRYEVYGEAPFTYNLTSSSVASEGWRLEYEPHGPSEGVDYAPEAIHTLDEFITNHHFYSQSAESPWYNVFLLRQRNAVASNELRGCMLRTHTAEGIHKTEIESYTTWREVLDEVFHEPLVRYSELERVEMWERIRAGHEEWKRTKQV